MSRVNPSENSIFNFKDSIDRFLTTKPRRTKIEKIKQKVIRPNKPIQFVRKQNEATKTLLSLS